MPKAAFNTTMSVYGSAAGVPDEIPLYVGVPCRFVPQVHVFPQETPLALRAAWVTYSAVGLLGPVTMALGPVATVDYGQVSWLEVDSMPGLPWIVLLTEAMSGVFPEPYWRASVCPPWWVLEPLAWPGWMGPYWQDDNPLAAAEWGIVDAAVS